MSSLRLPASKRVSLPASQRLSTISESSRGMPAPTVPLRSNMRPHRRSDSAIPMTQQHPAFRSQDTLHAGPPAYGAHGSSIAESEDLTAPVEGEKLAQLRREGPRRKSRGGVKRLLVCLVILLLVIGLAVGLGVGLTVGRKQSNSSGNDSGSSAATPSGSNPLSKPQFPLGEHSFVTALRLQQTNCTSRAATWRCYPYTTFDSSNNATSLAVFNWIITNTSAQYAEQSSGSTSSAGIPANLSISATNNPFALSFANQSLTYFSEAGNSSSTRYSFNMTMSRIVSPSPSITSNGQASQCFFNSTVLTGNIYLNSSRTYPDAALTDSDSIGGYDQWPYAVEISQVSPGGANIPDCYETVNGVITDRIVNGFTPQPASSQCICDYRNF